MIVKRTCRVCGSRELWDFLSLGNMPMPNGFLKPEQFKDEVFNPLTICLCDTCGMVQLREVVEPDDMFKEYAYFTGTSAQSTGHFKDMAAQIVDKFGVNKNSIVVDIGSNDGTLLQWFKSLIGGRVLGIDPAKNVAEYANEHGIETWPVYFNKSTADVIRSTKGKAKVVTATNVFAHVDDLHGFVDGVELLLDDDGIFVVEVPYLLDMIANVEFDTIYHEHLSYFLIRPLVRLFKAHDMSVVDVDKIDVHGGTIRVYVKKGEEEQGRKLKRFIAKEDELDSEGDVPYNVFREHVEGIKEELLAMLPKFKRVAGYGAAAKGNVLTNYCGIGADAIEYIADTTPYKQGLYSPGMHIPIKGFDEWHSNPPDGTLLLAWNYAKYIIDKEAAYKGKFIIPIPRPVVVGGDR